MAERSKALRLGRSRILPAWVRNPLLTFFPFILHSNCNQQSKTHILENVRMVDHEQSKVLRSSRSRFLPACIRIPLLTFFLFILHSN